MKLILRLLFVYYRCQKVATTHGAKNCTPSVRSLNILQSLDSVIFEVTLFLGGIARPNLGLVFGKQKRIVNYQLKLMVSHHHQVKNNYDFHLHFLCTTSRRGIILFFYKGVLCGLNPKLSLAMPLFPLF